MPTNVQPDRIPTGSDLIQVTLNLTRSLIREVEYLAAVKKCSRTQAIADAITLAVYFDRVVRAGGKVLVKRRGSKTVQIDLVLDHSE